VPTVLASIDRPFVVERPDELGGLVIAPALTVLPYRRVYSAMITPLVVAFMRAVTGCRRSGVPMWR
jgi:hypothetical protein